MDLSKIAYVLATNTDLAEVKVRIIFFELVLIKYKPFEYYNASEKEIWLHIL